MMHAPETSRPADAVPWRYSWSVLLLLVAVYSFNWMDRHVLFILLEPIRQDLGFSDTAAGLLTGFTFSVVYSLAGIPIARFADRSVRRTVIAAALALWSCATMLAGFARNFTELALSRTAVAIFEAGCSPAAHSLIADYFPARRRGTALAVYGLGISLGIWGGLTFGGLINERYGWRAAFFVLGVPGLLLALVVRLHVREPVRGQQEGALATPAHNPPIWATLRQLLAHRAFIATGLGLGLISFTGSAFENWTPTYLIRALGMSTAQAGGLAGFIEGTAGILGVLAAGTMADRLGARDARWYLWCPLIGVAVLIPAELLFFYVGGAGLAVYFFITIIGTASYTAPLFAIGQTLLPPQMRALGASVMFFLLNMVGTGGGTFFAGWMSDLLAPTFGVNSLKHAIVLAELASIPGAACLLYAARQLHAAGACTPLDASLPERA